MKKSNCSCVSRYKQNCHHPQLNLLLTLMLANTTHHQCASSIINHQLVDLDYYHLQIDSLLPWIVKEKKLGKECKYCHRKKEDSRKVSSSLGLSQQYIPSDIGVYTKLNEPQTIMIGENPTQKILNWHHLKYMRSIKGKF